jgi:outer membrane immunogenic protein
MSTLRLLNQQPSKNVIFGANNCEELAMTNRLSAVLIGGIAAIVFGQFATAADLPRKAPAYVPPPPSIASWSWTGCYAGLNAGGVWGNMDDEWTPNAAFLPTTTSVIQANANATLNAAGFTGGGQVGCNWQLNTLVLGAEADIEYTGLDKSRDVFVASVPLVIANAAIHEDFRSRWLATFRGRLGWLFTPTALVYATGGLALANLDATNSIVNLDHPAEILTVAGSETRAGWTVGGGVEWMFAPRWSVKAEYLYVDLGTFRMTSTDSTLPSATIVHDNHLRENIARLGVNYKFW